MRILFAIGIFALLLPTWVAWGGDGASCGGCPQCGCQEVKTVCRLVPQVTKVPKIEYSCKCEDICVPGRSQCVGTESVTDCNGHCHLEKVYQPTCGKVYTRSTLVKTTTTIEKCTYKCVAERVCCNCGCCRGSSESGYSSPGAPAVHHHVEPHPVHTQTN